MQKKISEDDIDRMKKELKRLSLKKLVVQKGFIIAYSCKIEMIFFRFWKKEHSHWNITKGDFLNQFKNWRKITWRSRLLLTSLKKVGSAFQWKVSLVAGALGSHATHKKSCDGQKYGGHKKSPMQKS